MLTSLFSSAFTFVSPERESFSDAAFDFFTVCSSSKTFSSACEVSGCDGHKHYQCMLIKDVLSQMITSPADCFWSNLKWTRTQHPNLYLDYILKKCNGLGLLPLIPTTTEVPWSKVWTSTQSKTS